MANKTVYLRSTGAETVAYKDQVTEGLWHIPPKATEVKPPKFTDKQTCKFIDEKWVVTDIPETEVEPEFEPIPAITQLRNQRNSKLAQTDWWCCSDQTPSQKQLDYRKALRDLPGTASPELDSDGHLTGVDWPEKPKEAE